MDNLFLLAHACLAEANLDKKLVLSEMNSKTILSGEVDIISTELNIDSIIPGRPKKPVLISPRDLPRRSLNIVEGRAAMIHSFAHIEFNAINLAWDLICRFQDMPNEFYIDWAQVAAEETKHFKLLQGLLDDAGYEYGDFPAHDGLWKIAEQTAHDLLLRLAVVPRIMEAKGLDVTPGLIERFRKIEDENTCAVLELILKEEIGHVNRGTKWYRYQCQQLNRSPDELFKEIAKEYLPSTNSKNINRQARLMAGFSQIELDYISAG